MKKIKYTLIVLIIILISIYIILNYIWKGVYENKIQYTIKTSLNEGLINISSDFGLYNSAGKVSYIDSYTDTENKSIYVWIYSKYIGLNNIPINWNDEVVLEKEGIYKIYYKNSDGSLEFIQEIEYLN